MARDDATGETYAALLVEKEGTDGSFKGLLETIRAKGLPCSLYTDRGSHPADSVTPRHAPILVRGHAS